MTDEPAHGERSPADLSDELHMWLGYCITEWASVEDQLFRICLGVLKAPETQAAIVFFRTPTMETRLQLIQELLEAIIPAPERKNGGHPHADMDKWKIISKTFADLVPIRNRLAHDQVRRTDIYLAEEGEDVSGREPIGSWFEIGQSPHKELRPRIDRKDDLLVGDLRAHRNLVRGLVDSLSSFYETVLPSHL